MTWFEYRKIKSIYNIPSFWREGICQCSSDKFIQLTKNPIETRSFFFAGVFIDQVLYGHLQEIYDQFRSTFKYPKLYAHGLAGMASPSWLIIPRHFSLSVRWPTNGYILKEFFDTLILDTKNWLMDNQMNYIEHFKKVLSYEIELNIKKVYPNMARSLNSSLLKHDLVNIDYPRKLETIDNSSKKRDISFFSKKYKPFVEARSFSRKLGLRSGYEWNQYASLEKRPDDVPANPRAVYGQYGWKNMGDWLGLE